MKLRTGAWVVVADGARGIVLVNEGTAVEPQLRALRTYGQVNPKTSAQGRAKPARTFGGHFKVRASATLKRTKPENPAACKLRLAIAIKLASSSKP